MEAYTDDSKAVSAVDAMTAIQAGADAFIAVINANITDPDVIMIGTKFVDITVLQIARRLHN